MKEEIKKQDQQVKVAYIAGSNAIVKQLGENTNREQMLDVVMLMAHSLLTGCEQLDLNTASHNANVFCGRLKQLITETQQNTATTGYTGRLM
jgi:hypothetical protein